MSRKSFFNRSKQSEVPSPQLPRTQEEIDKLYNKKANDAFTAQYQAFVYSKEAEKLNYELMQLNQEAAARKVLDKAAVQQPKEIKNE